MTSKTRAPKGEASDGALDAAIQKTAEVLRAAGPDGIPLRAALDELEKDGLTLPLRSSAITQLVGEGDALLTPDRVLLWADAES
jgi:hypothetical protein